MSEPQLIEVAEGIAAYVQPDGRWGLSNAGLVLGGSGNLLVDTLFDLRHTEEMLAALRRFRSTDSDPELVVNTHANGDHCYGNALLRDRRIIASRRATREMVDMPASKLAMLMRVARAAAALGPLRPWLGKMLSALGVRIGADMMDAAPYVLNAFAAFDFNGIDVVLPNAPFDGELELELGDRHVQLIELGPAHTEGDVVAFVRETRTLFAGDLVFVGMHPLVWAGTITQAVESLERLVRLDPDVVVPGHGNITDRGGLERQIEYLRELRKAVEPYYNAGATVEQAAAQLVHADFGSLREPERLVVNVGAAYRELSGNHAKPHVIHLFGAMARLAN